MHITSISYAIAIWYVRIEEIWKKKTFVLLSLCYKEIKKETSDFINPDK